MFTPQANEYSENNIGSYKSMTDLLTKKSVSEFQLLVVASF